MLELVRSGFFLVAQKLGLKKQEPDVSIQEALKTLRSLEQSFSPPLSSTGKKSAGQDFDLKDSGLHSHS